MKVLIFFIGSINEVNAAKAELEGPLVYPEVSAAPNPVENNCISDYCSPKHPLLSSSELGSYCVRTTQDLIVPTDAVNELPTSQTKLLPDEVLPSPETDGVTVLEDKTMNLIERIHQSTLSFFNKEDAANEKPVGPEIEPQFPPDDECSIIETQLSPRLTNLIESGFVPNSPIDDCGTHAMSQNNTLCSIDKEGIFNCSFICLVKTRIHTDEGFIFQDILDKGYMNPQYHSLSCLSKWMVYSF